MKRFLILAVLFCASTFADVALETPITQGGTTVVLRLMNPDITAPANAPKYLTVIYMAHSPRTALAQVVVKFTCDGNLRERLSWYGFGFPGPEAQSVDLACPGEVHIQSVRISEFSALAVNTF